MVAAGNRMERVGDLVRAELSSLLSRGIKDPRVCNALVTINRVEVSPDLRHAKVYISALAGDQYLDEAVVGLTSAAGYLRRELGRRVRIKYTPALRFEVDPVPEQTRRVEEALGRIGQEET